MKRLRLRTNVDNWLTYGLVIVAYVAVRLLLAGGNISYALQGQLVPITVYIVMAVSLNLTVGVLGELSLGHAGFMSVGAFSGAITATLLELLADTTSTTWIRLGFSTPWIRLSLAMLIGGIIAGIFGFLVGVPVLRLQGDYLAIVTLAFGEIIKNVMSILYVGYDANGIRVSMDSANALKLDEGGTIIMNGPMGVIGITKLSSFTAGFILILITLIIVLNLINSRAGRAIKAVRDDKIATESVGISVWRYRMMAFVTSATLAGAAGALYALNYSSVVARKFDFNTSILVLVFVVLGGMGNIRGSIIAATVLTVLPEVLRAFNEYRMLTYAVILIAVMLVRNNATLQHVYKQIGARLSKSLPIRKKGDRV
ncbi:MAG TPA: branched-chain amino acid ABC transporter permease [Bacillota bacterium]|nr:branched-chain amino acid ABC transporter permease [Bacillota bacterium]